MSCSTTLNVNIDVRICDIARKVIQNIATARSEDLEEEIAKIARGSRRRFFFKKEYFDRTREECLALLKEGPVIFDVPCDDLSIYSKIQNRYSAWERLAKTIIVAEKNGIKTLTIRADDFYTFCDWAE